MNKKLVLSTVLLLFIGLAIAQQPTGALTIFSEDGDKFFLILNGERQNNVAQTNLRVEDLTQPYYNAKIIFEDQTLPEISKNMLQIADYNNVLSDVTYKVKKDKNNGKMSLKYFSSVPIQQGFVPPSNVFVMHYGAPAAAVTNIPANGAVTQTTTTTTTTGTIPATNMNVNVNGMNMGVNITDPNMSGTVQTTTSQTTTTTSSSSGNAALMESNRATAASGCAGAYPMNPGDFTSALTTVKNQGFDDTKLSTAKQIAGGNCLSANQIAAMCKEFGFEETKLAFAKFAYNHCTEPSNYFKINNVFGFSSSVDELNKYIQNK